MINRKAREYAESESKRMHRLVGAAFTDYEKDIVSTAYKQAWLDALRQAELMYIYGSTGFLDRLKTLRQ